MYKLTIKTQFSAAHQLRGYRGKCENLHGHNWRVEVTIASEKLDDLGMVIDFKELKQRVGEILEELDHQFLNEHPPFQEVNPSSENIARHIFDRLCEGITEPHLQVDQVAVWESDTAGAVYYRKT
ncbi:MAG: 6-carboxytetrahydropterin synthase QueD [Deltaproteobacteria bacterium]|nr:MAG: 6-carboxytetrahydropterin synthase QueD [Deltaproteobacteria bacterium]